MVVVAILMDEDEVLELVEEHDHEGEAFLFRKALDMAYIAWDSHGNQEAYQERQEKAWVVLAETDLVLIAINKENQLIKIDSNRKICNIG